MIRARLILQMAWILIDVGSQPCLNTHNDIPGTTQYHRGRDQSLVWRCSLGCSAFFFRS